MARKSGNSKPSRAGLIPSPDFLDPFFKLLGWDMDNTAGYAGAYREVYALYGLSEEEIELVEI